MSTDAAASHGIQDSDFSPKVKRFDNIGFIIDHVSRALEKIEGNTVRILGMKDNSAPNHMGPLCAEVTAMWNEIQSLFTHPANFLSTWNIIESYQRLTDEMLDSVEENAMTEDNANDFGRRLKDMFYCFKENAYASEKSDEGVRRSSVAQNGGDHNFFKDIDGNVNIPQGNFVMNGHQTVIVNNNSSQFDETMKHTLQEILISQQRTNNNILTVAFFNWTSSLVGKIKK